VVVSETPRSGWAVASARSDTVALDLELSHELRLAGLLREIIRLVQDGRKNGGLEVSDRIELWWRIGGSPTRPRRAAPTRTASPPGAGHERAQGEPGFETRVQVSDTELGLQVWARKA
jgi:isoleucyl-tRNA synthetase